MLRLGSLYNRQILGFALFGTADESSGRAAALEKSRLEIQSRNMGPYDAAVTEYDLPVLSGIMKPDLTKGLTTVKYLSPATDTVFDSFIEDLSLNE